MAPAIEADHREFFGQARRRDTPNIEQGIIVLKRPPENDEGWERAVCLFVRFACSDFCAEEEEPDVLHEAWVEPVVGPTEAAKRMHEMRGGNLNWVVCIRQGAERISAISGHRWREFR